MIYLFKPTGKTGEMKEFREQIKINHLFKRYCEKKREKGISTASTKQETRQERRERERERERRRERERGKRREKGFDFQRAGRKGK